MSINYHKLVNHTVIINPSHLLLASGSSSDLFRCRLERLLQDALPWEISTGTGREGKMGNVSVGVCGLVAQDVASGGGLGPAGTQPRAQRMLFSLTKVSRFSNLRH